MKSSQPFYQIGLGAKALLRARLIFLVFSVLTILSLVGVVYAESKTHQISQTVLRPLKALVAELTKPSSSTAGSDIEFLTNYNESTSSAVKTNTETKIIINNNSKTSSPKTQTIYKFSPAPAAPSTVSDQAYQDWVKQSNEWFAAQKAANEAWYQSQVSQQDAKYSADYNAKVSQMNADYNAAVEQAKKDQEAWKAAHGF